MAFDEETNKNFELLSLGDCAEAQIDSNAINRVQTLATRKWTDIMIRKERILCIRKEHGEATVFCWDCHQFYCEECVSNHKLFDTMTGHRKRQMYKMSEEEIEDAKSDMVRKNCGKHGQLLTALCRKCNQLLYYLEFAIETQAEIEEASAGEPEFLHNHNDEVAERLGEQWQRVQTDVDCAKREVKETFQKVLVLVKTHEADMIRDIKRTGSNVRKAMERELRKYSHASVKTQRDATYQSANTLEKTGQAASLKNALGERAEVKATKQRRGVQWKFALEKGEMTAESLKLKLGSVNMTPPTSISDVRSEVSLIYDGKYGPSGMVVLGNILCATHQLNSMLWLYDMSSGATKVCHVPGLTCPMGLSLLDREEGLVVIGDNNVRGTLHFLKISQSMSMTDHKTKDMPFTKIFDIEVSIESSEILLAGSRSHLYVCNLEGDVKKDILVPGKRYDNILSVCRFEEGYAVLSTDLSWQGIILLLTEAGMCIRTLLCEEGEQLDHVDHMIADRTGRLIASSENEDQLRIVDTTSSPPKTSIVQLEKGYYPVRVYLDEGTDLLYVAGRFFGKRMIRVYEWNHSSEDDDENKRNFRLMVKLPKLYMEFQKFR